MNRWTRRSLLFGGALIALPVIGYYGGKLFCRGNLLLRTQNGNVSLLTSVYPDVAAARVLGKKYLGMTGTTATAALRRLQGQNLVASAVESACMADVAVAVEYACRNDFKEGRIHCIDGWILAQTELDVAALCTI